MVTEWPFAPALWQRQRHTTLVASIRSVNQSAWKVTQAERGVGVSARITVFAFPESRDRLARRVTLEICAKRIADVIQGAELVRLALPLRRAGSVSDFAPAPQQPGAVALMPRACCRHQL